MNPIIETAHVTKRFGKVLAVNDVSLSIGKGEIYGFLGLNGAGKTTTIRMLLGMIRPSSGMCVLDGRPVRPDDRSLWNSVGHLVEIPYSYPELTVRENLEITRKLRLLSDDGAVDAIIERMGLGSYRDRIARHLSLGNAQRLGLARAIIHRPRILILDEPANGLDPAGIVEIRDLLLDLAHNQGVTILVSSHILGEVSKFASRIGIIHEGKLIQENDTRQLDEKRLRSLVIDAKNRKAAADMLASKGFSVQTDSQGRLRISERSAIAAPEKINEMLVQAGCTPSVIMVDEEDLETYFLRIIGKNGGAA